MLGHVRQTLEASELKVQNPCNFGTIRDIQLKVCIRISLTLLNSRSFCTLNSLSSKDERDLIHSGSGVQMLIEVWQVEFVFSSTRNCHTVQQTI